MTERKGKEKKATLTLINNIKKHKALTEGTYESLETFTYLPYFVHFISTHITSMKEVAHTHTQNIRTHTIQPSYYLSSLKCKI